eukprot:TRINITY_DN11040_c0_g1_i1.p1 TRINITY_DN11040_c0_g1~~TRINITY_DN11040_c0_g1_i1.p1  ORF type:complete len:316 (-),score=54.56 TRINITY_DN11040_c0_g1_i1:144-1091(-)
MDRSFYERQLDVDENRAQGAEKDEFEDFEMYPLEDDRFTEVGLDQTQEGSFDFTSEAQQHQTNPVTSPSYGLRNPYPTPPPYPSTFPINPSADNNQDEFYPPLPSSPMDSSHHQPSPPISSGPSQNVDENPVYPRHPITCLFHLFFKVLAIAMYEITYYFWAQFIIIFVIVVTLLALDFWTVKNVTGRFLVGLRWWNDIREDGTNNWRFESISREKRLINPREQMFFWTVLGGSLACWVGFTVVGILSLKWRWLLICLVAIVLHAANLAGYLKCSQEARQKVTELANEFVMKKAADYLMKNGDQTVNFFSSKGTQ